MKTEKYLKEVARVMGIINLSLFAGVWLVFPLANSDGWIFYSSILLVLIAVGSMGYALKVLSKIPKNEAAAKESSLRLKQFNKVVGYQWLAIGVTVVGCIILKIPQYIPYIIMALVGLHFIPLVKLFKQPLYYGTAIASVLVAGTGAMLAMQASTATAPNPLIFMAMSCVLLVSAGLQLKKS